MTLSKKVRAIENFDRVPRFKDELELGVLLGSGEYNEVFAIKCIDTSKFEVENGPRTEIKARKMEMAKQCQEQNSGDFQYVMKRSKKNMNMDEQKQGLRDLLFEAEILSQLNHPRIITIRGVSSYNRFDYSPESNFFIILDRLNETLDHRFKSWQRQKTGSRGIVRVFSQNKHKKLALAQRLRVMYDLASALKHLHERDIMFRDIKQGNVGFDIHGVVKLFDFGLSKSLKRMFQNNDGNYYLTGMTGTLRYMAPEVAKCQPYNKTADVHSFGILLWEMCTLKKTYVGYNRDTFLKNVVEGGERPDCKELKMLSRKTRETVQNCFGEITENRPDFETIISDLQNELERLDARALFRDLSNLKL